METTTAGIRRHYECLAARGRPTHDDRACRAGPFRARPRTHGSESESSTRPETLVDANSRPRRPPRPARDQHSRLHQAALKPADASVDHAPRWIPQLTAQPACYPALGMAADRKRTVLDKLLGRDLATLEAKAAVVAIGHIVDLADDLNDRKALDAALRAIPALHERTLSGATETLLHYIEGNAWSVETRFRSERKGSARWSWDADDLAGRILAYRRALATAGFNRISEYQRCQILTNLGNAMSHVGRFVEAIDYWDRALAIDAGFGMALANKGHCTVSYLSSLYDPGHQAVFAARARELIGEALQLPLEGNTATRFRTTIEFIDEHWPEPAPDWPGMREEGDLGETEPEIAYRTWCLEKRLFINPLNDVLQAPIAATDALGLPTLAGPLDEMRACRGWVGLYNVLKQEFVAARALLWEGMTAAAPHLADRDVILADTLDGSAFGFHLEKLKLAFRSAYSILDRVGFLLNSYLKLGIPNSKVKFRTLWYAGQSQKKGLSPQFTDRENWPMRGLYWLAKDMDGHNDGIQECIEPGARALADVRNHLEHKYLKTTDDEARDDLPAWPDELGLRITTSQLEAKALHTVKLARAALIYVSLALHAEERARQEGRTAIDEDSTIHIERPPIQDAQ